jgi:hypothetical protein
VLWFRCEVVDVLPAGVDCFVFAYQEALIVLVHVTMIP